MRWAGESEVPKLGSFGIFGRAIARRELFYAFTKREVMGRYSGSFFGLLWSFLNPLLMLGVYTLAFREFLGMRWPNTDTRADFSLMIFSGMIVHSLFVEIITRAPTIIVSNANLVKKVVFPLALLPCVSVASAFFHSLLSIVVLSIFVLTTQHTLHVTMLYLPLLFLPYLILLSGIAWFMASLGVYFRDITQLSGVLASVFMFLSPVFYPITSLSPRFRSLMEYNPLTLIIGQFREIALFGNAPDWAALGIYTLVALMVMMVGYWWFQRTRDGFADVL